MRRRRFLSLLGAAATAPLAPVPALGRAAPAYSAAAYRAAVAHAQGRATFSVFGLSQAIGTDLEQTTALMRDLVDRGVLGRLRGSSRSGLWTTSRVFRSDGAAMARLIRDHRAATRTLPRPARRRMQVDMDALWAHVRHLAARSVTAKTAVSA